MDGPTAQDLGKMKPMKLYKSLVPSGHLCKRTRCFHCGKTGTLGKLQLRGNSVVQRCGARSCQKFNYPWHGHAVLHTSSGHAADLPVQMGILHCATWGIQKTLVPTVVTGATDKTTNSIYTAWEDCLVAHISKKQADMHFESDNPCNPLQVEADEGS